jgi:hypothetical protein
MTTILYTCTMDVFGDGPQAGAIEPATAVMRRRSNGHTKKPSKSTGGR